MPILFSTLFDTVISDANLDDACNTAFKTIKVTEVQAKYLLESTKLKLLQLSGWVIAKEE